MERLQATINYTSVRTFQDPFLRARRVFVCRVTATLSFGSWWVLAWTNESVCLFSEPLIDVWDEISLVTQPDTKVGRRGSKLSVCKLAIVFVHYS